MDAAKLDHIHLLGAQLILLRHSSTGDVISLKPTDQEPCTSGRGLSLTAASSTTDTGFVTWSGVPVMSSRIEPPVGACSEPAARPRSSHQLEHDRALSGLQQTVAEQNARIAQLEQKLADLDELTARSINQSIFVYQWHVRTQANTQNTLHSMKSRDTCLIFIFIEHPYNEVRV